MPIVYNSFALLGRQTLALIITKVEKFEELRIPLKKRIQRIKQNILHVNFL